jgi:sugar lactone lactonase YvrE
MRDHSLEPAEAHAAVRSSYESRLTWRIGAVLATIAAAAAVAVALHEPGAEAASAGVLPPTIATVAGSVCSPAVGTQFGLEPTGVLADNHGGFYVADNVRSVVCNVNAAGVTRVIAGSGATRYWGDGGPATHGALYSPSGLAVDARGNLFIADRWNQRVRKVDYATGVITTFAGNGEVGTLGDGGPATDAELTYPLGVAVDPAGNVYISDKSNKIRRVSPNGIIQTLAGVGLPGSMGDGAPARLAQLNFPAGLVVRGNKLDVADAGNNKIREIDLTSGTITTLVGTGARTFAGDGGLAKKAALNYPLDVATDGSALWVADTGNARVRYVNIAGVVSTVAGNGTAAFGGDGGPATSAQLNYPSTVDVDATGTVFVGDQANHRVRVIAPTGTITTAAGNGTSGFGGDGGPALEAELNQPTAVFAAADGRMLIADAWNHVVRVLTPDGRLVTVAGQPDVQGASGDGGPATQATLDFLSGVTEDHAGNIFIADWGQRIRKVSKATGIIETVAGDGTTGFDGDGGPARAAIVSSPSGLTFDHAGNLLFADTMNHRIRRIAAVNGVVGPDSVITTVAGTGVASYAGDGGPATKAALNQPMGVDVDPAGNILIADTKNQRIRRIDTLGVISTLVGNGGTGWAPDGTAAVRSPLNHPRSVIVDAAGALVLTDTGNCIVRRVTNPGTPGAKITTIAGTSPTPTMSRPCAFGEGPTAVDGTVLNNPSGVTQGVDGRYYIADSLNHRIRAITVP